MILNHDWQSLYHDNDLFNLYFQEMYKRIPRGKSLDPNPNVKGEYIEHKYKALTCNNGIQFFPMLNVCKKVGQYIVGIEERAAVCSIIFKTKK